MPDINPLPLVAHEVAVQLAAIGVQVTVSTVPPQTFLTGTLDSGHFQLAIDSWNPVPDPDVSAFWRSNAIPPHGYNVSGGAPDPFLDAALDMLAESPVARHEDRGSRPGRGAGRRRCPGGLPVHAAGVDRVQIADAGRADAFDRAGVRPLRRHCRVAVAVAHSVGRARGR